MYVAFFPQMVAGPIERPAHLLPQLHRGGRFDPQRLHSGLRLALWGLCKKAIVADLAAPVVHTIYANPRGFSGWMLLLATVLFAVQIYCDFSGYSDMAIGTARILGYDLSINFRSPYFARSPGEFWHRWHISLSTWFRDYVYIPLGGSRVPKPRWIANTVIVFLASALWHGANTTFLVWGGLHAAYVLCWKPLANLPAGLRLILTNLLVVFAWIFFRASTMQDAVYIATHLVGGRGIDLETLNRIGLPRFELSILLLSIGVVLWAESKWRGQMPQWWGKRQVRWAAYATAVYSVVCFGVFEKIGIYILPVLKLVGQYFAHVLHHVLLGGGEFALEVLAGQPRIALLRRHLAKLRKLLPHSGLPIVRQLPEALRRLTDLLLFIRGQCIQLLRAGRSVGALLRCHLLILRKRILQALLSLRGQTGQCLLPLFRRHRGELLDLLLRIRSRCSAFRRTRLRCFVLLARFALNGFVPRLRSRLGGLLGARHA